MVAYILACSIVLQLTSAVMAFRLIRLTGRHTAWSLIAVALLLMSVRRIIPFYYMISGNPAVTPDLASELVGLALSALMVLGVGGIAPLFSAINRSHKALQESEERFRKLFDCHSAIKLVIDPDTGRIVDANKAAAAFYGWSVEQLRQMHIQQINTLAPDAVIDAMGKTKSSEATRFEFQHRRADGSLRDVEVFTNAIEIGEKFLLHSIIHDITERKQAEDELKESEHRYRLLSDNVSDGVSLFEDNRVQYVSEGYLHMLGYSKDEITNISLAEIPSFLHEEDARRIREAIAAAHAHQTCVFQYSYRARTKSGKFIWLEDRINAEYDNEGKHVRSIIHSRDVTDRKRIENELMASQEQFKRLSLLKKAILESPEGIIVFALDVRYCYTDFTIMHQRTMKEIWGVDVAVGANMLDVITNESDRDRAKTNFDRALAGERFILEEAYGDEKLKRTYYENRYSPILAEDSSIVGLSVFVVDITDRKQAEDKIKQLLADKELLLHEVHHRIKNNMSTMMSLLSLQAGTMNDSGSVAALTDARRRMQSMATLYDKLYRSEGFKELSLQEYLSPLIREILKNFPNAEMVSIETHIEDVILGARILSRGCFKLS